MDQLPLFGWVLSSLDFPCTYYTLKIDSQDLKADEGMDVTLQQFWDLESLGVESDESSTLENLSKSISFKDGRYQVYLP